MNDKVKQLIKRATLRRVLARHEKKAFTIDNAIVDLIATLGVGGVAAGTGAATSSATGGKAGPGAAAGLAGAAGGALAGSQLASPLGKLLSRVGKVKGLGALRGIGVGLRKTPSKAMIPGAAVGAVGGGAAAGALSKDKKPKTAAALNFQQLLAEITKRLNGRGVVGKLPRKTVPGAAPRAPLVGAVPRAQPVGGKTVMAAARRLSIKKTLSKALSK